MPEEADNPLAFVTDGELLAELGRRHIACSFAGLKTVTPQQEDFLSWGYGSLTTRIGLAERQRLLLVKIALSPSDAGGT